MLSHARTEMKMIRELAADEPAYRSLTLSWYQHSPLHELLQKLAAEKVTVVITTDHGTIRVNNATRLLATVMSPPTCATNKVRVWHTIPKRYLK